MGWGGGGVRMTINPAGRTPSEPVTEVLHGVAVTDPYRWLEDQDSPRTREWLQEQTAYRVSYLDSIPGREQIRNRIEELVAVETVSEPRKVGNRYFFMKREVRQDQPVIMMREGHHGQDINLVDPKSRNEGDTASVSIV